jgi:hypothetical protein
MENRDFIAQRRLYAIDVDGSTFEIELAVGKPYHVADDQWACAVRVSGLYNDLCDMHGTDSWQALQLAQGLAAQLLGYFVEKGGKLFWEEGGEQIQLSELFT